MGNTHSAPTPVTPPAPTRPIPTKLHPLHYAETIENCKLLNERQQHAMIAALKDPRLMEEFMATYDDNPTAECIAKFYSL